MADVLSATRASGVPLRLRGGWAMDFFLGEATREHEGIDWFAWAAPSRSTRVKPLSGPCFRKSS
ncbi:hypothetical protein CFC35_31640 [Streptomyces sp. FBKL.4005]|nr:hypothetical protein [Streptomyces sp. FBKL.4005]OYP20468.1 hypothetical protein CFC35_31640 [Streptomyces sp. FBKL.4005]